MQPNGWNNTTWREPAGSPAISARLCLSTCWSRALSRSCAAPWGSLKRWVLPPCLAKWDLSVSAVWDGTRHPFLPSCQWDGCSVSPESLRAEVGSWGWYFKLSFSLQVPLGFIFSSLLCCIILSAFNYREYQKILPKLENRFALKWHLPILLIYTLFLHWSVGSLHQLYLT